MNAPTSFSEVAERLDANGYQVLPIAPGKKYPGFDSWEKFSYTVGCEAPYPKHGAGVLSETTPGVDVDVADEDVVARIENMIREATNLADSADIPRRVGRWPRVLIPFRTERPFKKKQTAVYKLKFAPADTKGSKVEILASGQQWVAYHIHPDTKKAYQWNGHDLLNTPWSELPLITEAQADRIIAEAELILAEYGERTGEEPAKALNGANGSGATIAEGGRNNTLASLAGTMRKRGMTQSAIEAALLAENVKKCFPPLPDHEVRGIAASVARYEPAAETFSETETEMDLAAAFARQADGGLLYVSGMDWHANVGPRWARDERLTRYSLANSLCRAAGNAAGKAKVRIETSKTASAIINIARPALVALPSDFDRIPTELNTPHGVIDLRDGTIRPRAPGDRYMHCTAVSPDARGIEGAAFADFLRAITCGDAALGGFLQRMLGAALFASNAREDHWLAFLVGEGRNGKETLIEKCASRALGTYARRIPAEVLLADDRGSRHPTEIANLVGARLAYASEVDEGRRWNEQRLKELSGGDKLSGRFMRQDLFEFEPSHRLVIYANHRPMISNPDPAFRARLKLVPFNASFVGREDTGLPSRLAEELPRILGWMIAGAAEYWDAGRLVDCPAVSDASVSYFELHSTFDAWLAERCYVAPSREERAKLLYGDFKRWKEERGEGVPSQTRWGETMAGRFQRRTANGVIWRGIGLRP